MGFHLEKKKCPSSLNIHLPSPSLSLSRPCRDHRVCLAVPRAVRVLGHGHEGVCVCLCLCRARAHHHPVLHAHGAEAEERADAVGLPREGSQPAADHEAGGGGGGRVRGVLDAHPHLHPGQGAGECARDHRHHGRLLLLCSPGLHKQQPQPGALRFSGRELQTLLQGLLPLHEAEGGEGVRKQEGHQCHAGDRPPPGEPGSDQQAHVTSGGTVFNLPHW